MVDKLSKQHVSDGSNSLSDSEPTLLMSGKSR